MLLVNASWQICDLSVVYISVEFHYLHTSYAGQAGIVLAAFVCLSVRRSAQNVES